MLNHIIIMGRMTKEPELRYTTSNVAVVSFTLAVDRDFANKDSNEKQTDFINCTAWRQTAEFVSKYFHKGSMAAVSGRLQMRDWTDRDGNKRVSAEVVAENVYFGEAKRNSDAAQGNQYVSDTQYRPYEPYTQYQNNQSTQAQYIPNGQPTYTNTGAGTAPMFSEINDDGELPF